MKAKTSDPVGRRNRPAKALLTKKLIVETALAIVDTRGYQALTMRSLARELDTGPAALYVYFANRDDIIDAIYDRILFDIKNLQEIGNNGTDWKAQIETLACECIAVLASHPGLAFDLVGRVSSAPNFLRVSEAYLRTLINGGITPETACLAVDLLNAVVLTEASEIMSLQSQPLEGNARREQLIGAGEMLGGLDPEEFPFLTKHSSLLVAATPDERVRWALRTLINGIEMADKKV